MSRRSRLRRMQTGQSAGHAHDMPGWFLAGLMAAIAGLLVGIAIVGWQAIDTRNRLADVEQYVAGKGEQRDRENAELNRRIDEAVCRVLDQLPAGRLDPVRQSYGCGPGQPPGSSAAPAPAPATTSSPTPSSPGPEPDTPRPAQPPPAVTAAPPDQPSPPPATPPAPVPAPPSRGPVSALVCAILQPLCPSP